MATTNFGTNAIVDERSNTMTDATYDSSATHDKVVGQMHVNNGKVEEKLGHALRKPEMEEKGIAKQAQGETEKAVGDSKKAVEEREKERDKRRDETEKERAKELAKVDKQREKELKKADKEAAKREKEARKLAEDRDKAFAREHGNAVLTAAERQRWDDEHFAAYQRLNGPTTTATTVVLPGSVETIGEERRRMEEEYGLERKRYLEMREAEYRRVYGEVALSEAERHRWDFGYLVAYRQAHPEFYLADRAVVDEAGRQAWVDEFELDTMRYELQRQRERQDYEHAREADFLRANGARELTAVERQEWDAEHLAEYRRRSNNPGFMTPLATITPAVHTGANKTTAATTTTSKANPHHTKHGVVTVGESRPGEAEYRVNPATGIAIQTETAVFTKDGKGSAVQHKTVDHPVVGTTVVDGVYVDNTHPATVVSTGAHDVQVGKMHERNGKMQEKIGHALHKPELEARGHAKQVIGQNEQIIGEQKKLAEERVKDIKKAQNV